MSKWAGKYVIGLTGNIGTGKSVTRRMLEHLGAYGVDADALAHRVIAKGAPGYQPVIGAFGDWILTQDEQIDRAKLGRVVFSDPAALSRLENIIHPLVAQAVDIIIRRAPQYVIVIEAIKLLESSLRENCDSIWVTYASPSMQIERLIRTRNMSETDARLRVEAQSPQEKKLAMADVVIKNVISFEDTWRQVSSAFQKIVPPQDVEAATLQIKRPQEISQELSVVRGKPANSTEIAELLNRIRRDGTPLQREDIMALFGEKALLLLKRGSCLVGVMGWQVENLVARTTDIVLDPQISPAQVLPLMIEEMERASRNLQCEASLVVVTPELAQIEDMWRGLGYEQSTAEALNVQAWQEAALESMFPGATMFYKPLRQDRVLRPI